MKISCSRSELRDALRVVAGVIDPRNIKPILKDIHIRTADDGIEVSATDLEVGIKYLVRDVEIDETGGIVIPADPIYGIVAELREDKLSMEVKDNHLIVQGKASRFEILGVSEEDFPEIPGFPEEESLEVEGAIFHEMVVKTIFAVGIEKQRYALSGTLFVATARSARLEMVGSDGRRLAVIRRKANRPSPFGSSAIIPVKALQQAEKMISQEEIIKINLQERQILLKTEKGVLVAQLVEGRFPPYNEVVPDDCDKKLEVQRGDFENAIRQAAVLASRDSRAVSLDMREGSLVVESSSPEAGAARAEIPVKYEGEPVAIRFNPDYLLDGIKAIEDDTIRLELKDPTRAAVMRAGPDYLYLIMPVTQD